MSLGVTDVYNFTYFYCMKITPTTLLHAGVYYYMK